MRRCVMTQSLKILVTGGAGFIGSAMIRHLIGETGHSVVNVDKLTYASSLESLSSVEGSPRYAFEKVDICDNAALAIVFRNHKPDAVMHLAAETHVDRSIDCPKIFVNTNIVGTGQLLETARVYWSKLAPERREAFRFHHVSTDEVFGSLGAEGTFSETTPYDPSSPYAASKAAADHLVRAWHRTYGLPVVLSNCSNNYGPYQFPEKLIPLMIIKALNGEPLPVYGDGSNVRDWLHVEDHARGLLSVLERGRLGESYNIGGGGERRNIVVVEAICSALDELAPAEDGKPRRDLIQFVKDRPAHDKRYAIDASKAMTELEWRPLHDVESGLLETVRWHLDNRAWWEPLMRERYSGDRLGADR